MKLVEEMYNGRVSSHSEFTPGVSTEPIPVCGSARRVKRKYQVRRIKLWELLYAVDLGILTGTEEELQRGVVE